jgi:putative sigma-54 modulation protein
MLSSAWQEFIVEDGSIYAMAQINQNKDEVRPHMLITYKARNMEISDAMKEYCDKRLARFDKLIGAERAVVAMSGERDRQRLEVTIPYNGMVIRGEEEGYDIFTCIDNVSEKLESQIHKYRERLIKKGRGAGKSEEPVAEVVREQWLEDEAPVKVKTFTTKPMGVEEAIMQMNLLGHSFFVFVNSDGNVVNALYRRNDGKYGLLTPEL